MIFALTRCPSDISPIPAKGVLAFYLTRLVSAHQTKLYNRIYASLLCTILGLIGTVSFDTRYVNLTGAILIFAGIGLWAKSKPPDSATVCQTLLAQLPRLKLKSFDVIDSAGKSDHLLITSEAGILERAPLVLNLETGDINVSVGKYRENKAESYNANNPLPTSFAPGTVAYVSRRYPGFSTEVKILVVDGEVCLIVTARGTAEKSEYTVAAEKQWRKMLTPEIVQYLMSQGIDLILGTCMSKCDWARGTPVHEDFILITSAGKQISSGDTYPKQVDVFAIMECAGLGQYCEKPITLRKSVSYFMWLMDSHRHNMTEDAFQVCLAAAGIPRCESIQRILGDCLEGVDITVVPPSQIFKYRTAIFTSLAAFVGAVSGAMASAWSLPTHIIMVAATFFIANMGVNALAKVYETPRLMTIRFVNYASRILGLRDGSIRDGVPIALGVTKNDQWHMSEKFADHIERFLREWVHDAQARKYWRARMLLLAQIYDEDLAKIDPKRRSPHTEIVWPWITAADKVDEMVKAGLVITPITASELRAQIA